MKGLLFALILLAAGVIWFNATPAQAWEMYSGRNLVVYVRGIDEGNTITVSENSRKSGRDFSIRLYGIGIPTLKQPFGKQAHEELTQLLAPGVKILITTVNEDQTGAINALVQLDDRSVNNRLIEDGLAWVDRSTCKAFFCRRWHIQESLAIRDKKGLWALNLPTPPWQWGEPR